MRNKMAELLAELWYQPDGLDHHAAADAVVGLLRQGPLLKIRPGYLEWLPETTMYAHGTYALVLLPEEE